MIRSRPGFQTQIIDDSKEVAAAAGAKLNPDMLPAIARRTTATPAKSNSPLTQANQTQDVQPVLDAAQMQARAEAAWARMKAQLPQGKMDPQIIENPTPSAPPITTDPYADLEA